MHFLKPTRNFDLVVLAAESQLPPAQGSVYACLCVYGVQVEAGSLSGSKSCFLHWARYHLGGMGIQPGDTLPGLYEYWTLGKGGDL